MTSYISNILRKISENINSTRCNGIIIASPSITPNYQYHWVRDSALVIRVLIQEYTKTLDEKYIKNLLDYVEIENRIQHLDTLGGLGEPKINMDGTPFNGEWGRPQNDGPALRSIMLIKILNLFKSLYPSLCKTIIIPMIIKDLNYILDNYNKPCFDLWEELYGWHWYTRMVQLKFLKDVLKNKNYFEINIDLLEKGINDLCNGLKDHINGEFIISSFNEEGSIAKYEDSANLLAYCHIEYDPDILKLFPMNLVASNAKNLISYFRKKYSSEKIYSIGRYKGDKYFNGEAWVICSLALAQISIQLYKLDNNKFNYFKNIPDILQNKILSLDNSLILSEQFNPITNEFYSAEKLTWNYSELYVFINLNIL